MESVVNKLSLTQNLDVSVLIDANLEAKGLKKEKEAQRIILTKMMEDTSSAYWGIFKVAPL